MNDRALYRKKNILDIGYIEEGKIRLSLFESLGDGPITFYQENMISLKEIDGLVQEIIEYMNRINRLKCPDYQMLGELQKTCQLLYNELFSNDIKGKLQCTNIKNLELILDEQLVHIPWELLFDGHKFLCEQFSVGRQVRAKKDTAIHPPNKVSEKSELKMLIIADPTNDLELAWEEGSKIFDEFQRKKNRVKVELKSSDAADIDFIKRNICYYDIIHYAGHAEYDFNNPDRSAWILSNGKLSALDILKMSGGKKLMPRLIFGNACQSGFTRKWLKENPASQRTFNSYGLVHAFLLAGVQYYIGTFCDVSNEYSVYMGIEFYHQILEGESIGEALRKARETFKEDSGKESLIWINYVLYGHPEGYLIHPKYTENHQVGIDHAIPDQLDELPPLSLSDTDEDKQVLPLRHSKTFPKSKNRWIKRTAIILLLLIFPVIAITSRFPVLFMGDIWDTIINWPFNLYNISRLGYDKNPLALYNEGRFSEAMEVCEALEQKNPMLVTPYIVKGNIFLSEGKLIEAETVYNRALRYKNITPDQKAYVFFGLGRIESLRNRKENALAYYQKATNSKPENRLGYLSQALLLDAYGDYDQALSLFEKAYKLMPDDHMLMNLINEVRSRVEFSKEIERQEHVDKLIRELTEEIESASQTTTQDEWTSPPLTLWVMDFKVHGYPLLEGQGALLISGITEFMPRLSRARLVERALFHKLIEELKLGNSKLIDRNSMLTLGKMLAARLILCGQLIYSGPDLQVSLRLIETETGEITLAINDSFKSTASISDIAENVSEGLSERLRDIYPLRGRIIDTNKDNVTINIGQMEGVAKGKQFRLVGTGMCLEVISVTPHKSLARVINGSLHPDGDLRVEEINNG